MTIFSQYCHSCLFIEPPYISRRDSPVRGQIYLLKIASIYGNFTPIGGGGGGGGGKMAIFGYFFEIVCAKGC